jgi:hypothetical protein
MPTGAWPLPPSEYMSMGLIGSAGKRLLMLISPFLLATTAVVVPTLPLVAALVVAALVVAALAVAVSAAVSATVAVAVHPISYYHSHSRLRFQSPTEYIGRSCCSSQ